MANPPCMSDDGNPAVFVGTMLQTGDAVALCDDCMVPWTAAVLYSMTGIDPTPFLAAASDDAGGELTVEEVEAAERYAEVQAPADPPPTPEKSGRSSRGSRARGTGAAPLAEAPPPKDEAEPDAA